MSVARHPKRRTNSSAEGTNEPTSKRHRSTIAAQYDCQTAESIVNGFGTPLLVGKGHEGNELSSSDDDGSDSDGLDGAETLRPDGINTATPFPTYLLTYSAPMGGSVYAVKRLDIIRALLHGSPRGKLTIPNTKGLPPFIVFNCDETIARKFLTKGEQLM